MHAERLLTERASVTKSKAAGEGARTQMRFYV